MLLYAAKEAVEMRIKGRQLFKYEVSLWAIFGTFVFLWMSAASTLTLTGPRVGVYIALPLFWLTFIQAVGSWVFSRR